MSWPKSVERQIKKFPSKKRSPLITRGCYLFPFLHSCQISSLTLPHEFDAHKCNENRTTQRMLTHLCHQMIEPPKVGVSQPKIETQLQFTVFRYSGRRCRQSEWDGEMPEHLPWNDVSVTVTVGESGGLVQRGKLHLPPFLWCHSVVGGSMNDSGRAEINSKNIRQMMVVIIMQLALVKADGLKLLHW